jgi:putative phage-type endonuclease
VLAHQATSKAELRGKYIMTKPALSSRADWLKYRLCGIGASEASAVLGLNPYMTNQELWEYKTGRREPKDISDKPFVQYGIQAEAHLRELFALDHPDYTVSYDDFDVVRNEEYPFILATLDGRLVDPHKRKGVLEIKTTEIMRAGQWDEWRGRVPTNYYIQLLHQLLATGWSFACLKAQIKCSFEELKLYTRHYWLERADIKDDLEHLLEREIEFWGYVERDVRPALLLPAV